MRNIRGVMPVLLLLITLMVLPSAAHAKDAVTIAGEISSDVESLFYTQKFKEINSLEEKFRSKESRLPDGRWKLTFIYSNLGKVSKRGEIEEWKQKFELIDEWLKLTPKNPTPYIAKAEMLISLAWAIRGTGSARTVTKEQWRGFHQYIAEARQVLEDSSQITARNPHWFLSMELIANAQGWTEDKFDLLYKAALSVAPAYYFIHFHAARYYLPRWNGSAEKLRAFAENAVKRTSEKEGLTLYTRIYWSQLWALKGHTFEAGYAEWPKMRQGFEDIMKDYPNSFWNLNAFAYYACMANDLEITSELIKKIGDNPHLSIWQSKSRFYGCKSKAHPKQASYF